MSSSVFLLLRSKFSFIFLAISSAVSEFLLTSLISSRICWASCCISRDSLDMLSMESEISFTFLDTIEKECSMSSPECLSFSIKLSNCSDVVNILPIIVFVLLFDFVTISVNSLKSVETLLSSFAVTSPVPIFSR